MAWHTGSFASEAAGSLLTVLDAYLPLNSHWSIYDNAAGTNCKVYECKDAAENCLFYVKVDDNYVKYAIIELWEGWNADTHAGVGTSLTVYQTTNTLRIWRPIGGWCLSVLDHRFVFTNYVGCGTYCGQPVRYDASKNIVVFIGETVGTTEYNPLSYINYSGHTGGRYLFDDGGGQALAGWDDDSSTHKPTVTRGIDGAHRVVESHITNRTTRLIVGALEGVMTLGAIPNGLARFDVVTVDGVDWMFIDGDSSTKYCSLVRKS